MSLSFLVGDVIYNAEFPHAAPDVIFGPEDEDFHPFQDRGAKSSLADWNNKDPTRLLALIQELRLCFEFWELCLYA